ncbi:cytochrome P450 monooxygenase [Pseudomassariella vexata]|uniref:Cytochrome P450 monooxygenase n=1 Tax=Pseudomassariella vexata TaxID=1141098 RepID=A0A1Y2DX59_9PEZI|nr:cytochrome P450 monooxygenase [Pseudomassariella vexata]ORY63878.1 cytochrome P450 monooxygenase [Pseudomassariella vexata]
MGFWAISGFNTVCHIALSMMSSKQFYLLGEDPSTAREIEIPAEIDDEGLRHHIASHFAIVDSKGIYRRITLPELPLTANPGVGFVSQDVALSFASDVLADDGPIAISIDGRGVREVPGPEGLPYIGNYFEVYPDHLGNHQRLFEKYGPLIKTTNMGSVTYQTNDPTLAAIVFGETDFFSKNIIHGHPLHPIKNKEAGVFLGDTDTEEWRTAHKFLPPAFSPKAVRHYAPTMQKTIEESFKVFDELDEKEESWNVYLYMLKLGSQAVGKLVLGMDFRHFGAPDSPLHEMVMRIAQSLELNKKVTSMGSWYAMMPFGDPKKLRNARGRIVEMITESIDKASKGTEDLELQDAALKAENLVDYVLRATDNKGNKLPKDRVMEPLVVATGAGFTTTSSLLSWLIYGLVAYPGMQDRLLQELIDNDFDESTQITAEFTQKLTFLDKYIKETQRRHNPSYQPARTAKVDMILPGGYKMPRDSIVIPALHHIHNNAKLWDNPTLFDPDRWDTEKVKNRPTGSYMPFATGPRMCIAFNFALQEVKVFLPKLVYRYKFAMATEGAVEYDPMFQLIRPNNLYVRAEKRVKWPPRSDA